MTFFINFGFILLSFLITEAVAWALHKYIMHGFLWSLHESHHVKGEQPSFFERNDFFFLFFALPSAYLIYSGIAATDYRLYLGIGIAVYGVVYFLVHDVFIHQRYPPLLRKSDYKYFRALRRAHHVHHKYTTKGGGEAFGLLWVAKKYFEKEI